MVTVVFIYRPLSGSDGYGSLYVRVTCRRQTCQWALNCRVRRSEWDAGRQRVILPRKYAERYNYLHKASEKLMYQASTLKIVVKELKQRGTFFGVKEIREAFLRHENEHSFRPYAAKLAGVMEANEQERTAQAYIGAAEALVAYMGGDILFEEITPTLLKDFENYMKSQGLHPNTTSYYMRLLRVICSKAWDEGLMIHSPAELFADVFTGCALTPKRALSDEELARFFSFNLYHLVEQTAPGSRARLQMTGLYTAWRIFYFSFHACGMCFVDVVYLRKDSISGDLLSYRRKKTGQLIEVTLTPSLQYIIDDFAPEQASSPYIFPILKNNGTPLRRQYGSAERTYNRRLQQLAVMTGIEGGLSSHDARHTWASMGKNRLFPVGVLGACLGHTSEKTTRIYLDSFKREILAEANRIITQDYSILPKSRPGRKK
ncbi:MAG: site-specific integrase [Tannerellaceae bacterium]|jgi:integrase|nr:site-specific integrase [Tannerellaceae bacterium]